MRPVLCYGEILRFFKTSQFFDQITTLTYVLMDNFLSLFILKRELFQDKSCPQERKSRLRQSSYYENLRLHYVNIHLYFLSISVEKHETYSQNFKKVALIILKFCIFIVHIIVSINANLYENRFINECARKNFLKIPVIHNFEISYKRIFFKNV